MRFICLPASICVGNVFRNIYIFKIWVLIKPYNFFLFVLPYPLYPSFSVLYSVPIIKWLIVGFIPFLITISMGKHSTTFPFWTGGCDVLLLRWVPSEPCPVSPLAASRPGLSPQFQRIGEVLRCSPHFLTDYNLFCQEKSYADFLNLFLIYSKMGLGGTCWILGCEAAPFSISDFTDIFNNNKKRFSYLIQFGGNKFYKLPSYYQLIFFQNLY